MHVRFQYESQYHLHSILVSIIEYKPQKLVEGNGLDMDTITYQSLSLVHEQALQDL